tara:strand:- start:237 stop:446 length:210 start_codon:yes stop_codon:yes gene_type:complete
MGKKQWGIWVGETKDSCGVWMSDGHRRDDSGEWHDIPALMTRKEAVEDAKLFSKGSKFDYSARLFEETP